MTATTMIAPLQLTRLFDAPPERVFDAWLSPDWGAWVGPGEVRGETVLMEPRVGGRYRIVMHRPDGGTLTVGGIYREIARPALLVFSWKWEHEEADTLITLAFRAVDGKTELHMTHDGFQAEARRDGHGLGWNGTLGKLAAYLAKA